MDCARNIITANFSGGGTSATTAPLWQWDYGQVLCITGLDLPAAFEVHFSTNRTGGVSTVAVGADGQVTIPNGLLTIGKNLNAWIYLSDAQGEGETEYSILIPVKARPMPETYDAEVTGEFDDVVRQVSEYAQTAQTAADNAGASASAAAASANSAAASASAAETAKNAAETAQAGAEDAQAAAETAAQTATQKAQQTEQDAAQAALDAGRAESAAGRAETAETGAESAKTAAETAANQSASYAGTASGKAALAEQSAEAAAVSATAAAQSAASIEGDVQIASRKAAEAQTAAGQAVTAKDAAVTAQQGAETAATNAGQSASTATAKASEAAQSASGAAQSKTDAEAAATRAETAAATLTVDDALSETSENPVQNRVITGEVTQLKSAFDDVTTQRIDTIDQTSQILTQYPEAGYINNDTGAFMAYNGYTCYYFTAPLTGELWMDTPTGWNQIAIYAGTVFNADDLVSIGSTSRDTLPTENSKMHVTRGNVIAICRADGISFSLHYPAAVLLDDAQLDAAYDDIAELEDDVSGLGTDVTGINAEIANLHNDIGQIAEPETIKLTRNSDIWTAYSQDGYINNDTGAFVSNELFRSFYVTTEDQTVMWFDEESVATWCQIAVYDGTIFSPTDLKFLGTLSRDTLPYENNKLTVESGKIVVVCIRNDVDFMLNYQPVGDLYLTDTQVAYVKQTLGVDTPIKIKKISSTKFIVSVYAESSRKYVEHVFEKQYFVDDGITTANVWYPSDIVVDGNTIAQGNANFIFYVDETGHTGHVGAGHGCAVAVWNNFYADGKIFDPTALTSEIECASFRFAEKVNHYLRDDTKGTWDHSIPSLDNNNDPIVVGIQYLDAEWSLNNRIKMRNRLDIVRNNTKFLQCHAAMCCGFWPYFDNIIIDNSEYVWNKFTSSDGITFNVSNLGGTAYLLTLGGTSSLTGDTVTLWGNNYRLTQNIILINPSRFGKSNILVQSPPYSDNRIKGYLMPCICSQSSASIAEGQTVETFNAGDRLEVWAFRELDV